MKPKRSIMPTREEVEATKRRSMTKARKIRIAERDGFSCRGGVPFLIDDKGRARSDQGDRVDFDHEIALELGGPDEDFNISPRCYGCACPFDHVRKTANDQALIAKARRLREREERAKRKRERVRGRSLPKKGQGPKIKSGGFQKGKRPLAGSKGSPWKKPIKGPAVRRD